MPLCSSCQHELDDASRAAGRCAACGAALHPLPQRTIADIRSVKPTDATELEFHDKTIELPAGGIGDSISIEIKKTLIVDHGIDLSAESPNAGRPSSAATPPMGNDDFTVHGATLELPPELQPDATDDANKSSNPTLPEIPAGALDSSPTYPTIADPPPLPTPRKASAPTPPPESPGPKPATITFGPMQTVEFGGSSSAIDESMLTSQWQGGLPAGGGTNLGATIKQKETITGTYVSSSSLIVKSRHVTTSTGGGPIPRSTSPADAPDYELLNVIGEGGMGVVYAARQSSIARTVALKMLKGGDGDTAQREKFISEAVVTGELDHPNIVPIYDLGANDDGALFYSMKRVKGTPWHKVVKERSLDENLNILLRCADAVAFAHANGVVHRDLKPENVMLGDFGEVLVMDWGLARVNAQFPSHASVTQSDAMGGTPAYMAPEMATGPLERITTASDIYLLGAILYEIITGKPPHTGKTVMACLFAAAKNTIAPTDKSGELIEIALKAMSTAPELRHPSVQDFQAAVREYQAHAESLRLLRIAEQNIDKGAASQDYEQYARAIYALEESLGLWPGNHKAKNLLAGARVEYARLALNKGDFDLGASLLDASDADHATVLAELEAGRAERESRQRRIKLLKGAVAALLALVIGGGVFAYAAVSKQRDEAVTQRGIADTERGKAELARADAVTQRDAAEEARVRAVAAEAATKESLAAEQVAREAEEKQRQLAEQKQKEAEEQRALADAARVAADKARADEEYAAYVARIGLTKVKLDENAFDRAEALLAECPEPLRDWEWGRLKYLTQLADKTWRADAPLDALAVSPDGQHIATGGRDGQATIWNLATGAREHEFKQGQYVHAVAYDAAGKRLAVGSSDGAVVIYDAATGDKLTTLVGHKQGVLSVRFSPDGARLLTCGYDNTARLWDVAAAKELQNLQGHTYWVWAAEFSPDGNRILTASQDGQAIVWELDAPERNLPAPSSSEGRAGEGGAPGTRTATSTTPHYSQLTSFAQHRGPIFAARFSPTSDLVATAGEDGRVLLWNPDEVEPVNIQQTLNSLQVRGAEITAPAQTPPPFVTLAGHRGPVRTLAFAPDGRTLASGGQDNVIHLWDVTAGGAAGSALKTLRGHASHVQSVSFAPDGATLLSAGRDHQIKLWNPAAYGETHALAAGDELGEAVLAARFSADGRRVITASRDRTASLWDAATTARLQHFQEGHDFLASSAAFFADGSRLATAAGDGTVRIWEIASGAETRRLDRTGYAAAVAVSDDGRLVATSSSTPGEALLWDAASGQRVGALAGHNSEVKSVVFAPGGQFLATGDDNGHIRLWRHDAASNQWLLAHRLDGHSRTITALAFVDSGRRLVSASGDNSVGQWDVATGRELRELVLRHPEWIADMAATPDGRLALTCCDDGKLRVWSLAEGKLLRTLETTGDAGTFTSVDVSSDGQLAAAACAAEGRIRLWNLQTGEELKTPTNNPLAPSPSEGRAGEGGAPGTNTAPDFLSFGANTGRVWAARFAPSSRQLLIIGGNDAQLLDLASRETTARFSPHGVVASADLSPDGTRAVTGSWDRTAKIWDAATGNVLIKLPALHEGYINSACFSPDGARVLTASDDGTARLWNAATGEPLETIIRGHAGPIHQALFSPDGKQILTVSGDKSARLWDAATGEPRQTLAGHEWAVRCAAFSKDGQLVITGSEDNRAMIWNLATGARLLLEGHTSAITAVALSPDGRRALTGSQDNLAKLWDAATGKEILTLAGHTAEVTAAAFAPDGLAAVTSSRDGQTLLWPAASWKP
jgi:WD40 repeat protein/serine/threonine protein kinase